MEQEKRVPAPWPSRIGMEPHKIHVMQASFFRVPEQEAAMKAAAQKATIAGNSKPRLQADRLLNASARLARKHSRGSDMGGEGGMLLDRAKRTTFDESLDPVPYRPTRKFTRALGAKSVSTGQEGSYVDAGLAFGRSFRVSWGPGGQLARIGGSSRFLCIVFISVHALILLTSSVINVDVIPMAAEEESVEKIRSSRLLQVHLKHSTIEVDEASVPVAFPSRSLTFSTFASLFPKHDNCHEAQVWRQGVALFDPPEQEQTSAYIPPTMKHQITAVQRRTALSEWLASTVAPTVANALRAEAPSSSAQKTFTRLTGYQIEKAVDDASAEGNIRLALLLSQAGGDAEFRADLEDQLTVWATEGADQFVSEAYRKCIALLAGVTRVWHSPRKSSQSESGDVNVVKGLDWKRTFGLALWYGEGSEGVGGYEGALHQYEQSIGQDGVALPLPWYIEDPALATSSSLSTAATASSMNPSVADEADALLELLRLATAATPLECAIYPRAFSPNRLDNRMPWHLYILLSRAMRLKDFSDRQSSFDDLDLDVEGHSEMADSVTCAYAAQLEALGQVQEAAFVLLHLEGSDGRKKAIKELLMRQAHSLESWQIFGLTSLRIPMEWIKEAQACLSQYEGKSFDAYEHFLKADEQRMAHDIAVNDLAPDAVVRGDLSLLRALFKPFDPQAVPEWSFRGKLFLDYADATEKIPELVAASQEDAVLDATDAAELERLKTLVPQLIRLLPDAMRDRSEARQNTALSEMLSGLLLRFDSVKSKPAAQPRVDSTLVDEATRLRHIHSTAYDRFIRSVSAAA
ncbi:nuclear protein 96-domain-containing protein [Gautieria morchelliformis]|nr:nuclear protein 96-domain-containing protein [Gautieria morchelliformis]